MSPGVLQFGDRRRIMDTTAMLIGRNAATRAPKTRISTIIAAGSPNLSSPSVRSDSESPLKWWSRVGATTS